MTMGSWVRSPFLVGDIILYFGSLKNIFLRCQSDMWDQHNIFMPCKQETIGGSVLTGLLFFIHDKFYRTSQRVYSSVTNVKERHNIMGQFVTNLIKYHKTMGLISNDADPWRKYYDRHRSACLWRLLKTSWENHHR
jgi:hypothetical protein